MMLDKHRDVFDTPLSQKFLEEINALAVAIRKEEIADQLAAIEGLLEKWYKTEPELKKILHGRTIISGRNAYSIYYGSIKVLSERSNVLGIVQGLIPR